MDKTQAAQMRRSSTAVADRASIRTGAAVHGRSDGSGQVRYLRPGDRPSPESPPVRSLRTGRAQSALGGASERRRREHDLHDSVQSELVALIVKLADSRADSDTPPAVADMHACLEARAQAALDSVRNIARGIRLRDRIEDLGEMFKRSSKPGCGTVLTLARPWRPAGERRP